jgi:small subunit ribosomal protein S3Ae
MVASKASQRAAARKIKDRWRAKNWYRVLAPAMFESVQIGETPADDPAKVKGRIVDVTLQQLTGDFSKMHIKLIFKIDDIKGSDAFSNFVGHSLTSDYIRRLTRRKRSKTDGVFDVDTKDGFKVRVKPMAVTENRIQTSQQHAIRMIMRNVIKDYAKGKLISEFIRDMIAGDISSLIFKASKPIYPIKRVEIRRSEILEIPERGFEPPEPEEMEEVEAGEEAKKTPESKAEEPGEAEPEKKTKAKPKTTKKKTTKKAKSDDKKEKKETKTTKKSTKTTKSTKSTKAKTTTKKEADKKKTE